MRRLEPPVPHHRRLERRRTYGGHGVAEAPETVAHGVCR
jgi:hypothetical protein